ncbi:hypothetical protein KUTeg_023041 [Tegillarca granosa]|uniref:N-acetylgalactosaminide beta-1,3-galactosyltransferase n=1 Tax=Tegillarca granosa TaxID=220873 RepID=A0ABQ9E3J8_TEGGR|nr:hypothetical protein KUTeg_023041 [Tegillarca granosa]
MNTIHCPHCQNIVGPSDIFDDRIYVKNLTDEVRILVWILTGPQYLDSRTIHVKQTWGRRCNVLLFFSSVENKTFPTIGVNTTEGREHLTAKSVFAWNYIYKNHFDDADWFMKADDNTYVIVENLRYFLSTKNTNELIFFGHHFQAINKNGFFSGGSGYVLSKAALKRYSTTPSITNKCRKDGEAEDAAMGECMEKLGVEVGDSIDSKGRSRFHCFDVRSHVFGHYPKWYYSYDSHGAKKGIENISDYPVSFHYIDPKTMYLLEFYIYHLKLYYDQFSPILQ